MSMEKSRKTEEWQHELQRHCEECIQIPMRQRRCNQHIADEESLAEITIDLVLQARAQMSENNVSGPEDAVVSEMIKQLP